MVRPSPEGSSLVCWFPVNPELLAAARAPPPGLGTGRLPQEVDPEAAGEQAQGPPTGHRGNRLDQADIWTARGTRSPWAGSSAELGAGLDAEVVSWSLPAGHSQSNGAAPRRCGPSRWAPL